MSLDKGNTFPSVSNIVVKIPASMIVPPGDVVPTRQQSIACCSADISTIS